VFNVWTEVFLKSLSLFSFSRLSFYQVPGTSTTTSLPGSGSRSTRYQYGLGTTSSLLVMVVRGDTSSRLV